MAKLDYKHVDFAGCIDCQKFVPSSFDNQYEGHCIGPICGLLKMYPGGPNV